MNSVYVITETISCIPTRIWRSRVNWLIPGHHPKDHQHATILLPDAILPVILADVNYCESAKDI